MRLLLLLFAIISISGTKAFSQKNKSRSAVAEKYTPKFDYTPLERESAGSNGLTVSLLNPIFMDYEIKDAGMPWSQFAVSLSEDLQELLTAKGFKVRGPFVSYDEMVFSDKKQSDFVLEVKIDLKGNNQRDFKMAGIPVGFKVKNGNVTLSGSINITLLSCMKAEKLWKKNLTFSNESFSYTGSVKWDGRDLTFVREMNEDVNLWNPTCRSLEKIYQQGLSVLWKQFDIEEMKLIAKEAHSADGKETPKENKSPAIKN